MGASWLGWFSKEGRKIDDVCEEERKELENRLKNVAIEFKWGEEAKQRDELKDVNAHFRLRFDCNVSSSILLIYCLMEVINFFQDQITSFDISDLIYDGNKLEARLEFRGAGIANLEIEREGDSSAIVKISPTGLGKISVGKLIDRSWQKGYEKFEAVFKGRLKEDEYQLGEAILQEFQCKFSLRKRKMTRTIGFKGMSEEVDLLSNFQGKNFLVETTRGWKGFEEFLKSLKTKLGLLLLLITKGLIVDLFFYCVISEDLEQPLDYAIDMDTYEDVFADVIALERKIDKEKAFEILKNNRIVDEGFKPFLHCMLDIGTKIFFIRTSSLESANKLIASRLKTEV